MQIKMGCPMRNENRLVADPGIAFWRHDVCLIWPNSNCEGSDRSTAASHADCFKPTAPLQIVLHEGAT